MGFLSRHAGKLSLVPHYRSLVQDQVCVRVGGGFIYLFIIFSGLFLQNTMSRGLVVEGSRTSRSPVQPRRTNL